MLLKKLKGPHNPVVYIFNPRLYPGFLCYGPIMPVPLLGAGNKPVQKNGGNPAERE